VLDPFGGSGVTAIEAVLEGRNGIHNDINPLANFVTRGVMSLSRGSHRTLATELEHLKSECAADVKILESAGDSRISATIRHLAEKPLPKNADVETVGDLFTPSRLSAIALIKDRILGVENRPAREALLLAWSATLPKLTRTFLSAEGRAESRGGSSIFSIYRYKVAKHSVDLPCWETFEERARNVLDAKREIDRIVEYRRTQGSTLGKFRALEYDVLELPKRLKEQVDFVFTDPPYGGHIAYLDLSAMWIALLDLSVKDDASAKEIIVGGDAAHDERTYIERLGQSIGVCVDLLKPERWLSVVFQHWNVNYLAAILDAAASHGAELRAAVSQVGDPIWSMHKKKSHSVLSGEFIVTFHKLRPLSKAHNSPATSLPKLNRSVGAFDLEGELDLILRETAADHIFGEAVLNRLIVAAWRAGAIDKLAVSKNQFSGLLESRNWRYDDVRHCWARAVGGSQARLF
jgi:hypothetical protein